MIMSTRRTTIEATITVPIIGGWRCSKCGAPNVSLGTIRTSAYSGVSGFDTYSSRRINEAKERASQIAEERWKENSLRCLMWARQGVGVGYYEGDTCIQNCACIDCGKSEVWSHYGLDKFCRVLKYLPIIAIAFAFIDMILTGTASLNAFLTIVISGGVMGLGYLTEKMYDKKFNSLPKESIPQITTLNQELVEYAASKGVDLTEVSFAPLVYEGLEYKESKKEQKKTGESIENKTQATPKKVVIDKEKKADNGSFCYNCGKPVRKDGKFCSYCGAKL